MKTILLALLVAVGLLNALTMTARVMADRTMISGHANQMEAELIDMRRQIAEINANAQTAGSFRRMSLDAHRQNEAINYSLNAAYTRGMQTINSICPTAP